MGGSMGKRRKRKAARRRGLGEEQRQRHRARARAELLYDPGTEPGVAAEILRELFGDAPVDLDVADLMRERGGIERLRAVVEAALAGAQDPAALSLAADVAIMDGRAGDAERHALDALRLLDDAELHLRLARALAGQGRVAAAMDVLDAQLRDDPGLGVLQLGRLALLQSAEPEAVDRFLDRTSMEELQAAMGEFVAAADDRTESLADGLQEWIEVGAITEEELTVWTERAAADLTSPEARRLRQIGEWAWLMPVLDDERAPLEAFAADQGLPGELRRRADEWLSWAMWGLWELERREPVAGAVLTDLVTGVRLPADVPAELLDGLPRWSVLLGSLVPVDGVWRAGWAFEVVSPIEARVLVHELLDQVMEAADELGKEARPMLAWARRVHEQLGPLWHPDAAEPPSQEALTGLQVAVRSFAPHLAAGLRAMRGHAASPATTFALALDDPDAAWLALASHPEFEEDEDGMVWLPAGDGEDDDERAVLERAGDGEILVDAGAGELEALLALLRGLGHPTTAVERPVDSEPPEPPVALPALPEGELPAWLEAWPDEPLDVFDGVTPRDAVRRYGAAPAVEALVRYLEHDADRRGAALDGEALRAELAREKQ
jgi:hypothetical protein